METLETDGTTEAQGSCNAARVLADVLDPKGPCEGPRDAVLLLSARHTPGERERDLLGIRGCVHHGAHLYVALAYAHVYSNGDEHAGCASEVYRRAQAIAQRRADQAAADAWSYMAGGMAA